MRTWLPSGARSSIARPSAWNASPGIDTSRTGFQEALGNDPVHLILDVLGGPAFADNLAVLAPRGRLIMLGHLAGGRATTDLGPILRKRLEIIGTVMRTR